MNFNHVVLSTVEELVRQFYDNTEDQNTLIDDFKDGKCNLDSEEKEQEESNMLNKGKRNVGDNLKEELIELKHASM